jgi:repressor LexA
VPHADLSTRQQLILDFIVRHIEDTGYPPSVREIGSAVGIKSPNGVAEHLAALQ